MDSLPNGNTVYSPPRQSSMMPGIVWGAVAVSALFHILATLGASLRVGRLSVVPTYDDVSYLVDGLHRLKAFDAAGFRGLFRSLVIEPAHAPLTTITATIGFALTPGEPIGTYALGGVWVILFLALAAILLKEMPGLVLGGILLAFLAVPALGSVISEFRPDLSWGLLTGFAGMLLLSTNVLNAKSSTLLLLGLLIGLDFVAKPTGALPVFVVLGTAYCVSVIASLCERRCGLKGLAFVTLVIAIGASIIVIPYFAVAGREIIAYVRAVMIEDTGIWQPVESTADHLLYYGRFAAAAMGWLGPTGFVFLGCQGVWLVVRDKSFSPDLVRFLGVILFVIISYAIPTIAPVHSPYFGYIFYGPAIVASLWSLAFLLRLLKVAPLAALLAGAVVFMLFWKPLPRYFSFDARKPDIVAMDEANRAVFPAISNLLSTDPARTPLVVMNISPGPVAYTTLDYFATLKGLSGTFDWIFNFESWEALVKKIESADINVITETGALGQSPAHFPIYQYQDRLIKMFQSDPRWHVIATYTDSSGFRTFAFARAPDDLSRQSR